MLRFSAYHAFIASNVSWLQCALPVGWPVTGHPVTWFVVFGGCSTSAGSRSVRKPGRPGGAGWACGGFAVGRHGLRKTAWGWLLKIRHGCASQRCERVGWALRVGLAQPGSSWVFAKRCWACWLWGLTPSRKPLLCVRTQGGGGTPVRPAVGSLGIRTNGRNHHMVDGFNGVFSNHFATFCLTSAAVTGSK